MAQHLDDKSGQNIAHVQSPPAAITGEDSDPDFDDLDDVLDQFSTNAPSQPTKPQSQPAPSSSGPGRPSDDVVPTTFPDPLVPTGPKPDESEEAFIARLSAEMSKMFSQLPSDASVAAKSPEEMAKIGKELEDFTLKMEQSGIKPEDLLKAILGEEQGEKVANAAEDERERRESETTSKSPKPKSSKTVPTTGSGGKTTASFDDTIRRTMSRLNESDTQAKTATQTASSQSEEDMLAEMLRALNSDSSSSDNPDNLSKMFTDMMQQLTNKDMLYEPMKELHDQYPEWLSNNKPPKTSVSEYERYSKQAAIVKEIVSKFEEPGFKDENEACRNYIWERMQEMQAQGAPPPSLVSNPFGTGEFGEIPGLTGPAGALGEEGCPTQ